MHLKVYAKFPATLGKHTRTLWKNDRERKNKSEFYSWVPELLKTAGQVENYYKPFYSTSNGYR